MKSGAFPPAFSPLRPPGRVLRSKGLLPSVFSGSLPLAEPPAALTAAPPPPESLFPAVPVFSVSGIKVFTFEGRALFSENPGVPVSAPEPRSTLLSKNICIRMKHLGRGLFLCRAGYKRNAGKKSFRNGLAPVREPETERNKGRNRKRMEQTWNKR